MIRVRHLTVCDIMVRFRKFYDKQPIAIKSNYSIFTMIKMEVFCLPIVFIVPFIICTQMLGVKD